MSRGLQSSSPGSHGHLPLPVRPKSSTASQVRRAQSIESFSTKNLLATEWTRSSCPESPPFEPQSPLPSPSEVRWSSTTDLAGIGGWDLSPTPLPTTVYPPSQPPSPGISRSYAHLCLTGVATAGTTTGCKRREPCTVGATTKVRFPPPEPSSEASTGQEKGPRRDTDSRRKPAAKSGGGVQQGGIAKESTKNNQKKPSPPRKKGEYTFVAFNPLIGQNASVRALACHLSKIGLPTCQSLGFVAVKCLRVGPATPRPRACELRAFC